MRATDELGRELSGRERVKQGVSSEARLSVTHRLDEVGEDGAGLSCGIAVAPDEGLAFASPLFRVS